MAIEKGCTAIERKCTSIGSLFITTDLENQRVFPTGRDLGSEIFSTD